MWPYFVYLRSNKIGSASLKADVGWTTLSIAWVTSRLVSSLKLKSKRMHRAVIRTRDTKRVALSGCQLDNLRVLQDKFYTCMENTKSSPKMCTNDKLLLLIHKFIPCIISYLWSCSKVHSVGGSFSLNLATTLWTHACIKYDVRYKVTVESKEKWSPKLAKPVWPCLGLRSSKHLDYRKLLYHLN